MSSTTIQAYATRESMTGAVKWIGGKSAYGLIRHWAGDVVELGEDGSLYLRGDQQMELVPLGNYVLLVGNDFFSFTQEEMDDAYIKVES